MTGGWGTRKQPPSTDPERPPVGPASGPLANPKRTRAEVVIDVMTGRCADGLHEDCPGHLLGVPCCCECHGEGS
jgi:hypothetical protein